MYSYVMKLVLENDSKKSISSASVVSCLKLLETYVVRRMFHGIESGGLLAVARGLWNNTGGDPDKMLDVLDSTPTQEFPEDDVFDKDIRSAHLYEKSDAFVTFIVDEYERGIESSEGYVERDDFTVDHIMPQTLSDDWDIAPSVHEKWLHTWSNLTPLSGGPNSKKSNRSWESTITMLKTEQSFKTTLRIANDNDRWDKDSLERRANHLVDWGLKRWPKSV
jgi:hypothetical protein